MYLLKGKYKVKHSEKSIQAVFRLQVQDFDYIVLLPHGRLYWLLRTFVLVLIATRHEYQDC